MDLPDGIQHCGDFSDPANIKYWSKYVQIASPDRFTLYAGATPSGRKALSLSVHPGDNLGLSSGERSEVCLPTTPDGKPMTLNSTSAILKAGSSILIPEGYAGTDTPSPNDWGIVNQLHAPDTLGSSPSVSLHVGIRKKGGKVVRAVCIMGGLASRGRYPVRYELDAKYQEVVPGVWCGTILEIKPAVDQTGFVRVWDIDETGKISLAADIEKVATLQYGPDGKVGPHYWKQGLYRGEADRIDSMVMEPLVIGNNLVATGRFMRPGH